MKIINNISFVSGSESCDILFCSSKNRLSYIFELCDEQVANSQDAYYGHYGIRPQKVQAAFITYKFLSARLLF